jgi:hypothetical protein
MTAVLTAPPWMYWRLFWSGNLNLAEGYGRTWKGDRLRFLRRRRDPSSKQRLTSICAWSKPNGPLSSETQGWIF